MSVDAVRWAFEQDAGSSGAKFVLVALADHADDTWRCWPSQKRLAARTGQGERTVRGNLAKLERLGLIQRTPRARRDDGTRQTDLFTINRQYLPHGTTGKIRHLHAANPAAKPSIVEPSKQQAAKSAGSWLLQYQDAVSERWAIAAGPPARGVECLKAWQAESIDLDDAMATVCEILDRAHGAGKQPPRSLKYFDAAVREAHERTGNTVNPDEAERQQRAARVRAYHATGLWDESVWGKPPDEAEQQAATARGQT